MPEYLSPGVYVEEVDRGPRPIEGVGTAMGAFVGFTEWAERTREIDGELVTTLVDDMMGAGNYRITWDGQSVTGAPVSSGLYLYRIQAGDFVQTMKMVLLK